MNNVHKKYNLSSDSYIYLVSLNILHDLVNVLLGDDVLGGAGATPRIVGAARCQPTLKISFRQSNKLKIYSYFSSVKC